MKFKTIILNGLHFIKSRHDQQIWQKSGVFIARFLEGNYIPPHGPSLGQFGELGSTIMTSMGSSWLQ